MRINFNDRPRHRPSVYDMAHDIQRSCAVGQRVTFSRTVMNDVWYNELYYKNAMEHIMDNIVGSMHNWRWYTDPITGNVTFDHFGDK